MTPFRSYPQSLARNAIQAIKNVDFYFLKFDLLLKI